MPAEEVGWRLRERDAWRTTALKEYMVTRRYAVRQSEREAEMQVRMQYRYPGVKRFDVIWSRGAGVLRDRVFPRLLEGELEAANNEKTRERTRITPENYRLESAGMDLVDGRKTYVLNIQPRSHQKLLLCGRVWIDAEDFAVVRFDGSPAGRPSFWIRSSHIAERYRKIDGFWLLASVQTQSKLRLFGSAELRIDNFDYRVNCGGGQQLAPRP